MSKPKRNKRTDRFEKGSRKDLKDPNANTPFARGGSGLPGGWTVNDKPVDPPYYTKDKLPKVIRIDNTVKSNTFVENAKAMLGMAKRLQKDGTMPIISPKMKAVLDASERKRSSKRKLSKTKEADSGDQG